MDMVEAHLDQRSDLSSCNRLDNAPLPRPRSRLSTVCSVFSFVVIRTAHRLVDAVSRDLDVPGRLSIQSGSGARPAVARRARWFRSAGSDASGDIRGRPDAQAAGPLARPDDLSGRTSGRDSLALTGANLMVSLQGSACCPARGSTCF